MNHRHAIATIWRPGPRLMSLIPAGRHLAIETFTADGSALPGPLAAGGVLPAR